MYPKTIKKLIEIFSQFPGIGEKTSTRFVFFLLKQKKEFLEDLIENLKNLKEKVRLCSFCKKSTEKEFLCEICENPARDLTKLCLVSKEQDLEAIEKSGGFNGLYFIVGEISSISQRDLKKINIEEIKERIKNPKKFGLFANFKEVILAFDFTVKGRTLSMFIENKLKDLPVKISKLGMGMPSGGELEYADEETLKSAFEKRN
jgi:recombination protein RecR